MYPNVNRHSDLLLPCLSIIFFDRRRNTKTALRISTTVEYDGESIIFTLDGKKYNVQFKFSNGAELGGVSVEGDTAVITFTFDLSMDPVFYRVIGQ